MQRLIRYSPGSRVLIRDAEWVVRRVDLSSDGGLQLTCDGISELVRDKSAIFLTSLDKNIQVLDPAQTRLVQDTSDRYQHSLLYMESLLRQVAPNDEAIHIADRAAMDVVPYQLEPTVQALRQPRQRILIADAVGLGKTLEAGILVSELIHRGRGRRILVLTLKSMLTQFQKEFWSRFTIPLTRLDSIGLQRVRSRIPTNHNPFYYYDKSIISIDTLKQDNEYRVYLEQAYWDIIIIDEAHNVADRGTSSLRHRLARLLASRSDTLIMLSATPHDGKARSFASLMNMLDPTAIADPENYVKQDFHNKGLVIRRFKKDIQNQVTNEFKERRVYSIQHDAGLEEEEAYETLLSIPFTRNGLHDEESPASLLRVTFQKALFSSPAACRESIGKRLRELARQQEKSPNEDILQEMEGLKRLDVQLALISPEKYAKYLALQELVRSPKFAWNPKDADDRLVIFSERIETLRFLKSRLEKDFHVKEDQIGVLHGGLSDIDQQGIVEAFGKLTSPLRVLLCSDVASEGINLHYLSHRLIHFDIPWSLMVFQQRNGRIDRYGQEKSPQIYYLITQSQNPTIRGDMRILEVLREKDDQAYRNIGDPSVFMHVYDIQEEEKLTARAIGDGLLPEDFDARLTPQSETDEGEELLALFLGSSDQEAGESTNDPENAAASKSWIGMAGEKPAGNIPSFFSSDYHYAKQALQCLKLKSALNDYSSNDNSRVLSFVAPDDLKYRFNQLPREIVPENWLLSLTDDVARITEEIKRSRQDENAWPKLHYLWSQHPAVAWLNDRMIALFGRHAAPVVELPFGLNEGETVFLISGLVPNRKSHPLIYEWMAVCFEDRAFSRIEPFAQFQERTMLGSNPIPNRAKSGDLSPLQALLPDAVARARNWMLERRKHFEDHINSKLNEQLDALEKLRGRQLEQLDLYFQQSRMLESVRLSRKEQRIKEIDEIFDQYLEWVQDTMTTEPNPYLQIISVLTRPWEKNR